MSTTTNTRTTPTQREKERIISLIQRLRAKHVAKYGTECRYLVRIGHRLGVTGNTVGQWSGGRVIPKRKYIDALNQLDKKKDPFDYSYLRHEKTQPGNNASGKV